MKTKFSIASSILFLVLVSSGVRADVIEYSSGFTLNNTSTYDSGAGYLSDSETRSTTVSLNRFDSSLGTLTDVDISFTSAFSHYTYASAYDRYAERRYIYRRCGSWWSGYYDCGYYVYNNAVSVNGSTSAQLTIDVIDPNAGLLNAYDSNPINCGYYTSSSGTAYCNSDSSDTNNTFDGTLNLAGISVSDFVGSDPIDLQLTNLASFYANCGNSYGYDTCYVSNDVYWGGRITVTYTYSTQVSEPGVLALLGLGLFGIGMIGRRRKSI